MDSIWINGTLATSVIDLYLFPVLFIAALILFTYRLIVLQKRASSKNLIGYFGFNRVNAELPFWAKLTKEWQYWDTIHRIEVVCILLIIVVALVGISVDLILTDSQYDISAIIPHMSLLLTWLGCLFVVRREYTLGVKHSWSVLTVWNACFIIQCIRISSLHALDSIMSLQGFISLIGLALVTIIAGSTLVSNRKPKIQNNDYSTITFAAKSTGLFDEDDENEEENDLLISKENEGANGHDENEDAKKKVEFKRQVENPQDRASFISKITFSWMTYFMKTGTKTTYSIDDIYPPRKNDYGQIHYDKMSNVWSEELKKPHPSLFMSIVRAYRKPLLLPLLLRFIFDSLTLLGPILLKQCIQFAGDLTQPLYIGLAFVLALFLTSALQSVISNNYFMTLLTIGNNIKAALLGMIYTKAFRLSTKERSKRTIGELVNHMAIDANIFNDLTFYFYPIFTPFLILVCIFLLWQEIGVSNLAGIGVIVLFFPLNFLLGRKMMRLQNELMKIRDSRSKLTNEVLQGIRVIKFFVWETKFLKQISDVRQNELNVLKKLLFIRALNMLIWAMMPLLISVASFALYTFLGHELTPEKAFTSLAIYNILRQPASWMPRIIAQIVESRVAINRLQDYLQAEELNYQSITRIKSHDNIAADNVIEVHNASFDWNENEVVIRDLNLIVKNLELVGIVGPVGAGKSSLLQALLGEMPKRDGRVVIVGQTAYCPQQAWMHNCTLRENVTFGLPYNKEKYDRVVSLCELERDLSSLPAGDMTEIGEKGINLSGGQKQRVSLARALYQDADVYLLDDCLSAVDAHVGKRIFENCIKKGLAEKTVILVTHQLQYLPFVDRVIVMEKGCITEEGHYDALMARGMSFSKLMSTHNEHLDELFNKQAENGLAISGERMISKSREIKKSADKSVKEDNDAGKLMVEEESAIGGVSFDVFKYYSKASYDHLFISNILSVWSWGSPIYLIFWLIFIFMDPALKSTSDWWLARWSNALAGEGNSNYFYLLIYFIISMAYGLDAFGYTMLVVVGSLKASIGIHSNMLYRVLRAPVSFFDTTPIGRILNRFNKDQGNIDDQLPYAITATIRTVVYVFAIIIVISLVTPSFLAIVLPLAFIYRNIQLFYSATSLQLRRLDSTTRSPIFSLFSSTIAGLSTIRAFARVNDFAEKNMHNIDTNNRAWLTWIACNRWLGTRLQFIGAFVVLISASFAVIQREYLTASLVGFAITYALSVTDQLVNLVRTADDLNNLMISVERCKEYLELPSEAPEVIPEHRPPPDWPTRGGIEINNLKLRYRPDLPLVLTGLTCTIKPAENIGIVGRTGAGKSSLMSALLRLVEAEEGNIVIDGINTATIGLDDLRSKIGIIPQDPLLFTGTIRSNLDPFEQYTDEDLWRALGEVQLTQAIKGMDGELTAKVNEAGENLSVGTRQLICLARSLLQKPRILLMDEASANVDFHTNVLIQETIKERFSDITVITIAHRIHTVMDCDRIMVLDKGSIIEFDAPQELLKNKSSQFYLLVKESRRKKENLLTTERLRKRTVPL